MQNQIKDMRCQVMRHNIKNPNRFYYKSLKKCWGFYKVSTYMIFNCTSFHIFNTKFYLIVWHGLRILRITIISFYELCMNANMNEMSSQGFMVYNIITNELEKLYEMLHMHS